MTLVKARGSSGDLCACLLMYKVSLLWSRPNRSFVAQAALMSSSTQHTSRIIDPGVVDYFFSHSGRPDSDAEQEINVHPTM